MKGLQELLDNLEGLGVAVRNAAPGAALAVAGRVKLEAINNAQMQGLVSTGALVNNIAVKRERDVAPGVFEYHIGVRHGSEAKSAQKIAVRGRDGKIRFEYENDPFYWWFWEFGHYNVFLRAHVAARPYMRPAMDSVAPQGLELMRAYLVRRLENATNKALR